MTKNNSIHCICRLISIICFLQVYLLLQANTGFSSAINTCVTPQLPTNISTAALTQQTLYGYIQSQITPICPSTAPTANTPNTLTVRILLSPTTSNYVQYTFNSFNANVTFNSISTNLALAQNSVTNNIPLTLMDFNTSICLVMPSIYGNLQLACQQKYYAQSTNVAPLATQTCSSVSPACYAANKNTVSQSMFGFTGASIQCVRESLYKMLFTDERTCFNSSGQQINQILNSVAGFQSQMRTYVTALLVLYTMFFGIRVALHPHEIGAPEIFMMIMKILLVTYFAVGTNLVSNLTNSDSISNEFNGVQNDLLPFLLNIMDEFVQMVFNAISSSDNLCYFDPSTYPPGLSYYAFWDAIDCRIGKYLYVPLGTNNVFGSSGLLAPLMIMKFLLSGNIVVSLCMLLVVGFCIIAVINFLCVFILLLITIYVLSYLAIIFIPLALFEHTKSYFESWLRLIVSCALQPMVMVVFFLLMLTIFDGIMFDGCSFTQSLYTNSTTGATNIQFQISNPADPTCAASPGGQLESYYNDFTKWYDLDLIIMMVNLPNQPNNILAFLQLAIWTFLFFFIMVKVQNFAAEITAGIPGSWDVEIPRLPEMPSMQNGGGATDKAAGNDGNIADKAGGNDGGVTDKAAGNEGNIADKAGGIARAATGN